MSNGQNRTMLSLAGVMLADYINNGGWCVAGYTGLDNLLRQAYDAREVKRAELNPGGLALELVLHSWSGLMNKRHTLFIPYAGPTGRDSSCSYDKDDASERIMLFWVELDFFLKISKRFLKSFQV